MTSPVWGTPDMMTKPAELGARRNTSGPPRRHLPADPNDCRPRLIDRVATDCHREISQVPVRIHSGLSCPSSKGLASRFRGAATASTMRATPDGSSNSPIRDSNKRQVPTACLGAYIKEYPVITAGIESLVGANEPRHGHR